MRKNTFGIWAMTLFIVGLMISISATAMIQYREQNEKSLQFFKQEKRDLYMDMTQSEELTIAEPSKDMNTLDIPAFTGIEPTISHGGSTMVGASFEITQENIYYYGSTDVGETWIGGLGWAMDDVPEKPCVDGCGDGRYIASCVPGPYDNEGSVTIKTTIDDVADFENTFNGVYWTWNDVGEGYYNFIDVEVAGYTADDEIENTWAYGCYAIIGDHGELGSQTGFFSYQAEEAGIAWIYTLANESGDLNDGTSCGVDIDHGNNFAYAVYNYDHGGTKDIYIFIMNFDTWGDFDGYPIHNETYEAFINSSGNDNALDVSALNDNVIIVSERDGSIVAYYSTDGLSTIDEVVIDTEGEMPRIAHLDNQRAVCSFVKNDILYTSITEDGGATWTTPNDNSENGPVESADICAFGGLYSAQEVIYFSPIDTSVPIVEIKSISGGFGVKAEVENSGTGDAVDVPYTITASGGLIGMINKESEGVISIPAGDSVSISLPMIIGLGSVTIDVQVGTASTSVDGTQLLIYTLL